MLTIERDEVAVREVSSVAGKLAGKVVLITGANGGLGTPVTQAFLNAGANVVGVSLAIRDEEFPHPHFSAISTEISSAGDGRKLVESVIAAHDRIDVLVHLMGGFAGGKTVADTDDVTFDLMLDANVRYAFYLVRAALGPMRAQRSGSIVAIGSRPAVEPQALLGAYGASKAALVSLIHTIAIENRDRGISANVILPGTMDTPGNRSANPHADFSKWVDPRQVAELLVHLASDQASQITGAVIPVYGSEI